jgi:hypothetical protein
VSSSRRLATALAAALAGALAVTMPVTSAGASSTVRTAPKPAARPAVPRFDHVVEVVLENEGATATFEASGSGTSGLQAVRRMGVYIPHFYGVGHASLDNYIAAFGAEQPNANTEADCLGHAFDSCTYPASVPTLGALLDAKGLSWKVYSEGMDGAPGGHNCLYPPDTSQPDFYQGPGTNGYTTRHNPAPWFDSVRLHGGNDVYCRAHNVDLTRLWVDAAKSSTLPTYSFIQPDTCHDGHDDSPASGGCSADPEGPTAPTGVAAINAWLPSFVRRLTTSKAWDARSLLIVTFDEGAGSDTSGCTPCQDGSAGGRIGAVVISGLVAHPGTVDTTWSGDHYSVLRTLETAWGLPTLESRAVSAAAAATVHDGNRGVRPLTGIWKS